MTIRLGEGERKELAWLRSGDWQEDLQVELTGPGASVKIVHVLVGNQKDKNEVNVSVRHRAPRTESEIVVRSVVSDTSQVVYRGLIDISEEARGAKGYQSGRGLLLNRGAVVDMIPRLAIRTNDVRCSHGVTTTHLDDLALFYMRSRGLSRAAARKLAIVGFVNHQLDLPISIRQSLGKLVYV